MNNRLKVGEYEFELRHSILQYVKQSDSGPGWNFSFRGPCLNDDPENELFMYGARVYCEAAPIPLSPESSLTGIEIRLPSPFDEESGEPFFGIKVVEEYAISDLVLRIVEQDQDRYRVEISGVVEAGLFREPVPMELNAWAELLPATQY